MAPAVRHSMCTLTTGANLHQSRLVLVTAGVIKGQFGTDRSYSSLFPHAALIVHEEAQQFGALVEAIAMAAVASCALRVWSGDKLQTPGGLERTDEAKATRAKVVERCQGIRMRTSPLIPDVLAQRAYDLCDALPSRTASDLPLPPVRQTLQDLFGNDPPTWRLASTPAECTGSQGVHCWGLGLAVSRARRKKSPFQCSSQDIA